MKLTGTWYNELGSKMVLRGRDSNITGTYQTKVGDAKGIYRLVGRTDTDHDQSQAVGWIVAWQNEYGSSDSVTAWSGQLQEIDGLETIVTTWLLTGETDPNNDWRSTLVGKDVFTRAQPTQEEIEKTLQRASHP